MGEPYGEAVATRAGPEPWRGVREDALQASVGVRVGWVLSRERIVVRGAEVVPQSRRQYRLRRYREAWSGPARSKTPCTHVSSPHGNWEVPPSASAEMASRSAS